MEKEYIYKLFNDFLNDKSSIEDIELLFEYFGKDSSIESIYNLVLEELNSLGDEHDSLLVEKIVVSAQSKLKKSVFRKEDKKSFKVSFRLVASIIAASFVLAFLIFWRNKDQSDLIPNGKNVVSSIVHKGSPGKIQAELTLFNGEKLSFNKENNNGVIDTVVVYESRKVKKDYVLNTEQWNVLDVPKGGTFAIQLPDGSNVWLNANSKLYFPDHFSVNERRVKVEGEVFFEVQKEFNRPFIVEAGNLNIKVIGTSFNVRSYSPEYFTLTLVTGMIEALYKKETVRMKPGTKVSRDVSSDGLILSSADVENAIAWKDGYFYFNNENLLKILDDISNWYDMEFVIEGAGVTDELYTGSIDRNSNLDGVLQMLRSVSGLEIFIENNRIKVKK